SATDVLDCLRTTRWDLFTAVAGIEGERAGDATQLIRDVVTWLKTDEHALAGGLAPKKSEGDGPAPKPPTPPQTPTPHPDQARATAARTRPEAVGPGRFGSGGAALLAELVHDRSATAPAIGGSSPLPDHDRVDDRGGAAMSVGALSPQQLRSIVEEKWERD